MSVGVHPILLVEDNPNDAELTLRAFKKSGITNEIIHVKDGLEALDFLFVKGQYQDRQANQMPELVLLDLKLPKLDGIGVLREIRSNEKTRLLPVIILTSSAEEKDIVDCYGNGANSYVQKPVDFVQFSEAVKQLGRYWLVINQSPFQ